MKYILIILLTFLLMPKNLHAQLLLGFGGGYTIIPKNEGISTNLIPNGESFNSPYIWISSPTTKDFSLFNIGLSVSGYVLEKWVSVYSNRISLKWEIPQYNLFITYRTMLGIEKESPSLGIRAGGTYAPITISGEYQNYYGVEEYSDSEDKVGLYLGADIIIPILKTNFSIFLVASKSFIKYEFLEDNVNLGSFTTGFGLPYTFYSNEEKY